MNKTKLQELSKLLDAMPAQALLPACKRLQQTNKIPPCWRRDRLVQCLLYLRDAVDAAAAAGAPGRPAPLVSAAALARSTRRLVTPCTPVCICGGMALPGAAVRQQHRLCTVTIPVLGPCCSCTTASAPYYSPALFMASRGLPQSTTFRPSNH